MLQRIALPPDMFIPSNNEEEEVDVVDVSEDENKENDGGNTKEAKVKGKSSSELPIESGGSSSNGGGGGSSTKVIIVNEDTEDDDGEVSFKGGKNSGFGDGWDEQSGVESDNNASRGSEMSSDSAKKRRGHRQVCVQ